MHSKPRILVLGDLMVDLWADVTPRASNPEGAAMAFMGTTDNRFSTLGGAGLVASLLQSLGANVRVMGQLGRDYGGQAAHTLLHENDLTCKSVVFSDEYVTPTKMRFVNEHGIVVFRYDEEASSAEYMAGYSANFNFDKFKKLVSKADCVVIADYGKGYCQEIGPQIVEAARYYGALTIVGAKPQLLNAYRGADIVKVNKDEAEAYLTRGTENVRKPEERDPSVMVEMLCHQLNTRAAVVTTGGGGSYCAVRLDENRYETIRLPATACFPAVRNCVGAGDAYLAGMAAELTAPPALAAPAFDDKTPFESRRLLTAMAVGSAASAQYLSRGVPELDLALPFLIRHAHAVKYEPGNKVLSFDDAQLLIQAWHSVGEHVVFTNGCFDLLHAGHLHVLTQAKKQGTRLVVAVNTDDSVRNLKGTARPIQSFETRAQVLANLSCVDAVVALDEEDFVGHPVLRAMITSFHPEVLVKGAQYKEEDIVGWEELTNRENPGRLWRCPMIDGVSTTNTIQKVQSDDA